MPQAEKDAVLTADPARRSAATWPRAARPIAASSTSFGGDIDAWQSPADVPPLPVVDVQALSALSAVPPEKVVRELHSSSTTGQQPSRIVIDKTTAFRQSRALVSILKEHIGDQRRPLPGARRAESVGRGRQPDAPAARPSAAWAISPRKPSSPCDRTPAGDLAPDWDRIADFFAEHRRKPVLLFGFTFIVWTRFVAGGRAPRLDLSTRRRPYCCTPAAGRNSPPRPCRRTSSAAARPPCSAATRHASSISTAWSSRSARCSSIARRATSTPRPLPTWSSAGRSTLAPGRRRRDGHHRSPQHAADQLSRPGADDRRPRRLLGVDDCPCGRKGQIFPLHQPHRAGRSPRLRRHLRPIEGNPMSVLRITPDGIAAGRREPGADRRVARTDSGAWLRRTCPSSGCLALFDDFAGRLLARPRTARLEGSMFLSAWLGAATCSSFCELNLNGNPAYLDGFVPKGGTIWRPSRTGWWPCGWPATWPRCRCSRSCRRCWPRTSAW